MGKGSRQRPITNKEEFAKNWDKIFGKKDKQPTQPVEKKPNAIFN